MAVKKWDGRWVQLGACVAEYAEFATTNYAVSTVENIVNCLRALVKHQGADKWVHEIQPWDMTAVWLEVGKTRGNNALVINHQAYKHFFKWCASMHYYPAALSPMAHINAPKPFY